MEPTPLAQRLAAHKAHKDMLARPALILCAAAGRAPKTPHDCPRSVLGALPLGLVVASPSLAWSDISKKSSRDALAALIEAKLRSALVHERVRPCHIHCAWTRLGMLWLPVARVELFESAGIDAARRLFERALIIATQASPVWKACESSQADELYKWSLHVGDHARFEAAAQSIGLLDALRALCAGQLLRECAPEPTKTPPTHPRARL